MAEIDAIRQHLIESLAKAEQPLHLDHRRVERLLGSAFPERPWPCVALHAAVREGVAADLALLSGEVPAMAFDRLVRRLVERAALASSSADWAVQCWAEALGLTVPEHGPRLRAIPRKVKANPGLATRPHGAPWNLRGHRRGITSIDFRPDGAMIATGSLDRTIRLWDPRSGQQVRCLMGGHRDWVRAVAFSPDGKTLVSGGDDGAIRLWDPANGERKHRLHGHDGWVRDVVFSSDGRMVVSGGRDGFVCLWEAAGSQMIARLGPFEGGVSRLAFDRAGQWLAVGRAGAVEIWDLEKGARAQLAPIQGERAVLAAGRDNRLYIGDDRGAFTWSVARGEFIQTFPAHEGPVRALALHPNGRGLLTGGRDQTVRLWHALEGHEVYYFKFRGVRITALAFHPQGHVGIAFSDGNAQLREMIKPGGE